VDGRCGRHLIYMLVSMTIALAGCSGADKEDRRATAPRDLIVFHAGSLSVPMSEIALMFEAGHPGVSVLLEAAGSRTCARKIAELGRPCDVMASADYRVIDNLLIPDHADWDIHFAGNEMAIVYDERSRRADEIDLLNWYGVLLDPDVSFGRSDPDSDPCGYRAVLTARLAEGYYHVPDLADRLLAKDTRFIRPKETDLLALLESGAIDYIFLYRSVAMQHGLRMVDLPGEIDLGDPAFADRYAEVSVEVSGREPGTTIVHRGAPMVYGVTIPKSSPSPELAAEFVAFLLDPAKGLAVMERSGQPPLVPAPTDTYGRIPERLRRYALPPAGRVR
jgi:molybdate/tungstate transport system substrate-binding protein